MQEGNKWAKFWELMGKFSVLFIVIWTGIQIFNSIFKSEYRININAEVYAFEFPSFLNLELDEGEVKAITNELLRILHVNPEDGSDNVNKIASRVFQYSILKFPEKYIEQINKFKSIRIYTMKNESKQKIEEIKLELEDKSCGVYMIIKKGEKSKFGEFIEKIDVGTLFPSEDINIRVWTVNSIGNNIDDCKVMYLNGFNNINYPVKVSGFWRWFHKNSNSILILTVLLIFLVSIFLLVWWPKYRKTKKVSKKRK
jgi:hypothetical protein